MYNVDFPLNRGKQRIFQIFQQVLSIKLLFDEGVPNARVRVLGGREMTVVKFCENCIPVGFNLYLFMCLC